MRVIYLMSKSFIFINIYYKRLILLFSIILLGCLQNISAKESLSNVLDTIPTKVGEGRLKVYLWAIYDAELFSTNGHYKADQPHLLKLTYLRDISTDQFANRAIKEMKKQGLKDNNKLKKWYELLMGILPNVKKGDSISVATNGIDSLTFWLNDDWFSSLKDEEFKDAFLNIWLSDKASFIRLRNKLTNTNEP